MNDNVIRLQPPGSENQDIEIVHKGTVAIAMSSCLPLPEALRWAADVLEGKAMEPSDVEP